MTTHPPISAHYDIQGKIILWRTLLLLSTVGVLVPIMIGLWGTINGFTHAIEMTGANSISDPELLVREFRMAALTAAEWLLISFISIPFLLLAILMDLRIRRASRRLV